MVYYLLLELEFCQGIVWQFYSLKKCEKCETHFVLYFLCLFYTQATTLNSK